MRGQIGHDDRIEVHFHRMDKTTEQEQKKIMEQKEEKNGKKKGWNTRQKDKSGCNGIRQEFIDHKIISGGQTNVCGSIQMVMTMPFQKIFPWDAATVRMREIYNLATRMMSLAIHNYAFQQMMMATAKCWRHPALVSAAGHLIIVQMDVDQLSMVQAICSLLLVTLDLQLPYTDHGIARILVVTSWLFMTMAL